MNRDRIKLWRDVEKYRKSETKEARCRSRARAKFFLMASIAKEFGSRRNSLCLKALDRNKWLLLAPLSFSAPRILIPQRGFPFCFLIFRAAAPVPAYLNARHW